MIIKLRSMAVRYLPPGHLAALTTFLALATQQGGVLLTGMLAFAILGAAEYGRTASALAFLNIFIALGSMSSTPAIYRYILADQDNPSMLYQTTSIIRKAVICSGLAVTLFLVGAVMLNPSAGYLKSALVPEVATAALFLLISVAFSYQQGLVIARGQMETLFVVNIIILVLSLPLGALLILRLGYTGFFFALLIPLLLRGISLRLREPAKPADLGSQRFDWKNAFVHFIIPATAAGFTTLPAYWLATEALFHSPGGAAALGLITLAISIKQAPMLFATSLISSSGRDVFAMFSRDPDEAVRLHRKLFRSSILPMLGLSAAIALGAGLTAAATGSAPNLQKVMLVASGIAMVLTLEILNVFVYMPVNIGGAMWRSLLLVTLPKDMGFIAASYLAIAAFGWPGFLVALIIWNSLAVVLTVAACRQVPDLRRFYALHRL